MPNSRDSESGGGTIMVAPSTPSCARDLWKNSGSASWTAASQPERTRRVMATWMGIRLKDEFDFHRGKVGVITLPGRFDVVTRRQAGDGHLKFERSKGVVVDDQLHLCADVTRRGAAIGTQ